MGVMISPDSEYAKELAKWEKPYRFEPFPKMVYKAIVRDNGKVVCCDPHPLTGEPDSACMLTVPGETELRDAIRQGWRETPTAAIEHYEGLQKDIATAAAEANAAAVKMSPKAQAERKAREAGTDKHVSE